MRFLLAGGGTGGHVYPALAIAEELRRRQPDCELLYVGTEDGLEARLVPAAGLAFKTVPSGRILGKKLGSKVGGAYRAALGVIAALGIIRRFRPDAAIGTGGFASGPAMLAAALRGVPVILQEQNAYPGMTNRLLASLAGIILVSHPQVARGFPAWVRGRVLAVGNPVRPEVLEAERTAGASFFGLDPQKTTVLVSSGSGGAKRLNQAALGLLPGVAAGQYQLIWATGSAYHRDTALAVAGRQSGTEGLRLLPYLERMPLGLAVADLVVARAGAMTLAEITARGIPAVLVPSPNVVHNHQELNARLLEGGGAAVVLADAGLTEELLAETVAAILGDRRRRERMVAASRSLGRPGALGVIGGIVTAAAGGKGTRRALRP